MIDLDTLLGTGRSDTDFNTSITIFSKFTSEELVQFGVEDTIGDLLSEKKNDTLISGLVLECGCNLMCKMHSIHYHFGCVFIKCHFFSTVSDLQKKKNKNLQTI